MTERENVAYVARACLGTAEGSARHKTIVDIFNMYYKGGYMLKITDAWCAAFVSAVYIAAGLPDRIPIECSCGRMWEKGSKKELTRDREYEPKVGDIIFYDFARIGITNHVGIVSDILDGKRIRVIEGNHNDIVGYRNIPRDYLYTFGYIAPNIT